jgi:ABC-type multidrug transport system ATPase subunit
MDNTTSSTPARSVLTMDFDPKFSSLINARRPTVALEWQDIDYTIKEKKILHGLSGQANPGEVLALMGPSGAGKTTLLNILAGRIYSGRSRGHHLQAEVRANGVKVDPHAASFRRRIAYVTQDDALYATATARESLEFSARLRLPNSVSAIDRATLVDDIIASLGLSKVQNTMVGSALVRGLSGGERKRVSIGVELVSSPSVLFLDEPTSGLDSVSAWKVVRILRALANLGGRPTCTVICSIHQPSSEVFLEFSHCVFLGLGHVVYQGIVSTADLEKVFGSHGFHIPLHANPSDFVMMAIQIGDEKNLPRDDKNVREPRPWGNGEGAAAELGMGGSMTALIEDDNASGAAGDAGHANVFVQAVELSRREFRGLLRDHTALASRYGALTFLAVITAILFYRNADQSYSGYSTSAIFGSLVLLVMSTFMGNVQPYLLSLPLDKVIALREMGTASYGVIPYAVSKIIVEIPVVLLAVLLVLVITYWSVGFHGNFGLFLLWLFLSVEAGISFAYVLGSLVNTPQQAVELAPVVLVPQFLFIGLFSPITSLPYWLQWPQWLASFKYALNLMMVTELDPAFCTKPEVCVEWAHLKTINNVDGENQYWWALVLVALAVGLRLVSMVIMAVKARMM